MKTKGREDDGSEEGDKVDGKTGLYIIQVFVIHMYSYKIHVYLSECTGIYSITVCGSRVMFNKSYLF